MSGENELGVDVARYFQIAVSGAIEQAFTAPVEALERSAKTKTISDEIADQVRAALVHTVRTTFKDNFQVALDKEVKSIVAKGFGLKLEDLPQHGFFHASSGETKEDHIQHPKPKPVAVAESKTQQVEKPVVAAVMSNTTAPSKAANKPKQGTAAAAPKQKAKPAPIIDAENLTGVSSLALRSPITPKINIPAHIAEPTDTIVTTPLSYDAHRQIWTEEEIEGGSKSAPAQLTRALKIPEKLALAVNAGAAGSADEISTTPVSYKTIGGDLEAVEISAEEQKSQAAAAPKPRVVAPHILPGSVLPGNTNPDSTRAKFQREKGISVKAPYFAAEEQTIVTTPVNAKGQEIPEDGYSVDDESDASGKNSSNAPQLAEAPKKFQPRRKASIRGLILSKQVEKRMSTTGGKPSIPIAASAPELSESSLIPAECETPTPRTKANLKEAKFGFGGLSASLPDDKDNTISSVSFDQPLEMKKQLKARPKEKNPAANKLSALKATYEDGGPKEPHSAVESIKKMEVGIECPSPTAKRGRLQRSATVNNVGSSKTMPALNRPSMTILAEDNAAAEECRTPHSRELANNKFEFPKPPKLSLPSLTEKPSGGKDAKDASGEPPNEPMS